MFFLCGWIDCNSFGFCFILKHTLLIKCKPITLVHVRQYNNHTQHLSQPITLSIYLRVSCMMIFHFIFILRLCKYFFFYDHVAANQVLMPRWSEAAVTFHQHGVIEAVSGSKSCGTTTDVSEGRIDLAAFVNQIPTHVMCASLFYRCHRWIKHEHRL